MNDKPAPKTASDIWAGWEERARVTLIGAMKDRKVSYKALSRRLESLGIYESAGRLNRKVNRARFSAAFFLACLEVLAVRLQHEQDTNDR